jgi:hypothetical protein
MPIPDALLPTTCDIYRPFGGPTPIATGVKCKLVAELERGRGSGLAGNLMWSHYIDLNESVDIQDGCSRTGGANAITYADGDEVRVPAGGGTVFVVVWIETRQLGAPQAFKRAYLLRHSA